MTTLNTRSARVIDPVLSGIAQGYTHAQRVGHVLFPAIEVMQRGGKVIEFGRESFFDYKARRAPGADAVNIQFGYEGKPYSLDQFSLDVPVPREHAEDAQAVPGIDLGKRAVVTAMDSLTLSLEIEQAELASNPTNYAASNKLALAGTARWNQTASTPISDIEAAKDQVRKACGVEPNRMVISSAGFKALKYHASIAEKFKYTTADSITAKMLANLLELDELAVGKATYVDSNLPGAQFKEAWGNAAILAYVPTQDAALEQPSFGYTYTLKGHPFVEPPRWEGGKRSWIYGVTYERKPVLTGIASGFLFTNIVGA
ncbi:major capsid protein [Tabrizicola fusiformis]|uniref:major capsid protein n=1 Tax=Tabrizicola sp. SY72 TaxID=2741673 RepID=UPI0015739A18|nr:major capsid protein [Tabrizicola sp. SY72]NTT85727.1 major capsid protein [Tabrizicola sp. SY72]